MRRNLRAAAIAVWVLVVLTFQRSDYALHTYGVPGRTANGGVVIGDCYHWDAGLELWGRPGFFIDEC